jgi:thioredoxin-dependent peroxiredoxin
MAMRKAKAKGKTKTQAKLKAALGAAKKRVLGALSKIAPKKKTAKAAAKPKPTKKPKRLGHRPVAPRPKRAQARRKPAGPAREGGPAPEFALLDDTAQLFSSHVLEGQPFVVYFYPKDDTPGCTKEACEFRDRMAEFSRAGIDVIGISPDSPNTHARFRDKYNLPFRLLSDEDRKVAKAFGVWVKKQNYGRQYMGIERSTFLIDERGRIKRAWRGVRVPGHVDTVLSEVRSR